LIKKRNMTTSDVLAKFKLKHGDKYDYSCVEYKSYYEKVKIGCNNHGYFLQTAHHHYEGRGCPSCAKSGVKLTRDRVIADFRVIHGGEFDYDKFRYKNDYTKSIVTCRQHGDFSITPNSHKNGTKCPYCFMERSGFGKSKFIKCAEKFNGRASLYLLKLSGLNECFYKIGITTDLEKRFIRSKTPYNEKLIKVVSGNAALMWELEKEIHRLLFDFRYKPNERFSGSTECFSIASINYAIDILDIKATDEEISAGHRIEQVNNNV